MNWRQTHPIMRLEWQCPRRHCHQTALTGSRVRIPPICRAHLVPMKVKKGWS